tara:strand:+ start:11345 stop:11632 length:288 start_codon:yes stop_codon:yes gene_type:complete
MRYYIKLEMRNQIAARTVQIKILAADSTKSRPRFAYAHFSKPKEWKTKKSAYAWLDLVMRWARNEIGCGDQSGIGNNQVRGVTGLIYTFTVEEKL